jgi:hypothetical protein
MNVCIPPLDPRQGTSGSSRGPASRAENPGSPARAMGGPGSGPWRRSGRSPPEEVRQNLGLVAAHELQGLPPVTRSGRGSRRPSSHRRPRSRSRGRQRRPPMVLLARRRLRRVQPSNCVRNLDRYQRRTDPHRLKLPRGRRRLTTSLFNIPANGGIVEPARRRISCGLTVIRPFSCELRADRNAIGSDERGIGGPCAVGACRPSDTHHLHMWKPGPPGFHSLFLRVVGCLRPELGDGL